jgi:ABC-type transport system substrate-binding protein
MNMDDVLYSYNKFAELNPSGANVANARNPAAPVLTVEATDDTTLVIKLAKPDATALALFAATDHLYIMPTESDGQFNPETEVHGNGPWQLQEYVPSSKYVWMRNPNYYIANRPFPDVIERPIITETAQQLAQFRAGAIQTDVVANSQQEVIQLKKDVGDKANLWLPNTYANSLTPSVWFGYEGDSPFKDQRVRQAFSMLVDREAFNSALYNADVFAAEGLGTEAKFNTCVTAGWGPYWLDPQGSDFGPNAKYLQFNLEEAKALLNAAGLGGGFDTEVFFNSELTYGPSYHTANDVFAGFFSEGGARIKQTGIPYAEYLNTYYFGYQAGGASTRGSGDAAKGYNGYTVQAERPYATAVNLMLGSWHSRGGAFHGLTPDGNDAFSGDPEVDSMIEAIQAEFDQGTQVELAHDLIRYMTERSYMIPRPVVSPSYQLWHVAVSGVGWKERWPNNAIWTEEAIDYWIDSSKL